MIKIIHDKINVWSIGPKECNEWTSKTTDVCAYMKVSDIKNAENSISFKVVLSGIEDATDGDIKHRIDEYLDKNETVPVQSVSCIQDYILEK